MKRAELNEVVKYIQKFKKIDAVFRVDDSLIKVVFDKKEVLYFDMTKGNSTIFTADGYKVAKSYNAPFDTVLKKRCVHALCKKTELLKGNKIIRFFLEQKSSYKSTKTILQFEFTGRHTNVIICDEDFVILEALRHIDKRVSYREIQNGLKLIDLPPREFLEKSVPIDDIKSYLYNIYRERERKKLNALKNQKLLIIAKKKRKLEEILDSLEDKEMLLEKAREAQNHAEIILSHLKEIKNYQKKLETVDFNGKKIVIEMPNGAKTPAHGANILFSLSKKAKQKAKNIHKERENLLSKIDYYDKLSNIIENIKTVDELLLYFPKKERSRKKERHLDGVEDFYYEDYKISLGKNEKANATLLKNAKMSDIWMHLKDIPSTHVIIRSNKRQIRDDILEFGANLCVKFSTTQKGSYLVDYTQRRNVKVVSGAKVNYINYKTIKVDV